jgi:hypothetical protein
VRPLAHNSESALLRNVLITAQCKLSADVCQLIADTERKPSRPSGSTANRRRLTACVGSRARATERHCEVHQCRFRPLTLQTVMCRKHEDAVHSRKVRPPRSRTSARDYLPECVSGRRDPAPNPAANRKTPLSLASVRQCSHAANLSPKEDGPAGPPRRPLLGPSKAIRGLAVSLLVTTLVALLLGLQIWIGLLLAAAAMAGDLLSSFLKRRLHLAPGSKATGLDQIPESLFPPLACRSALSLTAVDMAVGCTIFFWAKYCSLISFSGCGYATTPIDGPLLSHA